MGDSSVLVIDGCTIATMDAADVDGVASSSTGMAGLRRSCTLRSWWRAADPDHRRRSRLDRRSAIGTIGGAHNLGRQDEIGSLEVGQLVDVALWRY